jgi:predicted RNA-binding Zn-ribbon protein involved in translation (DUF1610 family)
VEHRTLPNFVCPFCENDEINELTVCVVSYPVKKWGTSGEPTAYGNPIVDWQSTHSYNLVGGGSGANNFECPECGKHFAEPKLACG